MDPLRNIIVFIPSSSVITLLQDQLIIVGHTRIPTGISILGLVRDFKDFGHARDLVPSRHFWMKLGWEQAR